MGYAGGLVSGVLGDVSSEKYKYRTHHSSLIGARPQRCLSAQTSGE